MRQNKYDDPAFFDRYSRMPRSVGGLDQALEWPALRALLPDLRDARVLDLGCGFGWHCRYARQQGARSVVGVDLSERMLARARAATDDPAIAYRRAAIEDVDFPDGSFDLILSSLALHYIADWDRVCRRVHAWLAAGGVFVLSVEHPIFTARAAQEWHTGDDGERRHWPVDDYQEEGPRESAWLGGGVLKYHRTFAGWVGPLLAAGLRLTAVAEPSPSPEAIAARPELADERRRPMFLMLAAVKAG